jgi:tetratricopeptide (TPR) repeat protein
LIKSYTILLVYPHIGGLVFRGGFSQAMLLTLVIWLMDTLLVYAVYALSLLGMTLFLPIVSKLNAVAAERCQLYFLQWSHHRHKNSSTLEFITGQLKRRDYLHSQMVPIFWSILYRTTLYMPMVLMLTCLAIPPILSIYNYLASLQAGGLLVCLDTFIVLMGTECARLLNARTSSDGSAISIKNKLTGKLDTLDALQKLAEEEHNRSIGPSDLEICLNPDDAVSYNNRGKAHMANSDYQSAIDDFNKALQIDAKFAEAYCNRGEALGIIKLSHLAITNFDQGCRLYLEQGRQEDFQVATTKLKAMKSELSSPTAGLREAIRTIMVLFRPELLDQPATIEPSRNVDVASEVSLIKQANILFQEGNYKEALIMYDRALELNPYSAKVFVARGDTYLKLTQPLQAREDFKRALFLDPHETWTYISLSLAYCELGQPQDAIADLTAGLKLCRTERDRLYLIRAHIFIFMDKYEDAIEDFDKFISTWELSSRFWDMIPLPIFKTLSNSMKTDLVGAYRDRGGAFDKLGNLDRAASDFAKALQLENKLAKKRS